jgi:EAL domain-containing protein (putative c-di-GMP-specific phosphodiesterase class I)/ActR/RegA family two-component response regulator
MPKSLASGPGSVRARRLLIVDDEVIQRLLVARAGELCGMQCDGAATLDDADSLLSRTHYDVVVLDLALGEHDGIELLRSIHASGCDAVLIFISGFDERVRQAAARLASALGLRVAGALGKPLPIDTLRALLGAIPEAPLAETEAAPSDLPRTELEAAIEGGEILCLYQPKVRLADRRIVGMEVLTRWRSPLRGLVQPSVFIPLVEHHGLIDRLTERVLEQALTVLRGFRNDDPELTMAVNLSPLSLTDLKLPERISAALELTGTPPAALVVEITEGAVMADYVAAADILTRLRIRGIGISIDDFGTGHSSLLSLLRMPFNEIKIDRSFISQVEHDPDARKIVRAVITLARELEVEVVAEGIETEAVAQVVTGLGCPIGQGYLFARPLGEAELSATLQHGFSLAA